MGDTVWDIVGDHWTIALFLPAILIVIAILAAITHLWDSRK